MIDFTHLRGKQVLFRLMNSPAIYSGIVRELEERAGLWIECQQFIEEIKSDMAWANAVDQILTPVMFLPISSLMFLVAAEK